MAGGEPASARPYEAIAGPLPNNPEKTSRIETGPDAPRYLRRGPQGQCRGRCRAQKGANLSQGSSHADVATVYLTRSAQASGRGGGPAAAAADFSSRVLRASSDHHHANSCAPQPSPAAKGAWGTHVASVLGQ